MDDNYLEDLRANSPSQGENDGGQPLSIINSSIKSKEKLMDVICEELKADQVRKERTVPGTVVQSPVRHPGSAPSKLPDVVLLVS